MVRIILFFAMVALLTLDGPAQDASSTAKPTLDSLSWIAGHWGSERNGRLTEESWMAPKGGLMLGVNRSVTQTGKTSFEFLRIQVVRDKIVYYASPGGSQPTAFPLKSVEENVAVFENPKHDFPQRIIYRLQEGQMVARIEGKINGNDRSMEWKWNKMNPGAREN